MKVSLKWLRDYVDVALPPRELADKLTMSGTEVGGIQTIGGNWENIAVGQVSALTKHPNADRLLLATVDLGKENFQVICGAPNIKTGQKVPFAGVGAELIDPGTGQPTKLKTARIRGVVSEGMVCSEKELGISDRHEGIVVLPEDAPVGTPLAEYLGDVIFDLKITPNRPDCLSVIGIAREVAALTEKRVRLPEVSYDEQARPIGEFISIEIVDPDLCRRYCASLVTEVKVKPSPRWMQERLLSSGVRPINNVVDITNYVMLEYGQPMHAFDYHKIAGKRVLVRRARGDEAVVTLDGVERYLTSEMLVIADEERTIGLAGVMGGANTEITEQTTSVLLESANFNQVNTRRTSAGLRLRSEASLRFERGLSPELPLPALRRATQLMVELAEGKVARGIIDLYPGRLEREPILLTVEQVRRILGIELSVDQLVRVLGLLGFRCETVGTTPDLIVTVPYWRIDIRLADDLVEEVARIIGYDQIPTTTLSSRLPSYQPNPTLDLREKIRNILVGCGLQEIITYSLTSQAMLNKLQPKPSGAIPLRVANPLTLEQEYLRTTLRGSLLATLAANEKHEEGSIRLFEIGKVYLPRANDLPEERELLTGVVSSPRSERSWLRNERSFDFFYTKGILEILFDRLGVEVTFEATEDPLLLPGKTTEILTNGTKVGIMGELHPEVATRFDISSHAVCLFEADLEELLWFAMTGHKYRPLPRFPAIVRDIALAVDAGLASKEVQDIIQASPLVSQVRVFDVYRGKQVPPGKRSIAYSVVYQSPERTLTDEEVDKAQQVILDRLKQELGATLRG